MNGLLWIHKVLLAEKLVGTTDWAKRVFFANSGTEAMEAPIKVIFALLWFGDLPLCLS